jgi:bifunctional non-homologous end joining protein LigD
VPLVYYVFDLLSLEGKDLRKQPLSARRKLLAEVLKKAPENIRLSKTAGL